MADNYSTKVISDQLKKELLESVQNIKGWDSVEICIQDYHVIQITEKNIKKTNNGNTKR